MLRIYVYLLLALLPQNLKHDEVMNYVIHNGVLTVQEWIVPENGDEDRHADG